MAETVQREQWGSRIGLILAMAGNAVGLGNFLRFPRQAVDNGGVISDHSQTRIAAVLSPEGRRKLVRIPPPVDLARFVPGDGDPGPVVVAAGRLIAQKGVDRLLDVWPVVARLVPGCSCIMSSKRGPAYIS